MPGKTDLTPKQEKFAQAVAGGANLSDAYRQAYDAKNMSPKTINVKACMLMAEDRVTVRVKQLREPAAGAALMTLAEHLADLRSLRNIAVKHKQVAAAVSAEVARAKAMGISIDRSKVDITGTILVEALPAATLKAQIRGGA